MTKISVLFFVLIIIIGCNTDKCPFKYPETKKVDSIDTYFGTKVPDPYRWLECDTASEVAQWVRMQNDLTFNYLKAIPFRDKIKERLIKIWDYPKKSAPFRKGDYYFYYYNDGLQNQSVLYKQKGLDGTPEILLDPNLLSEDGTASLSTLSFSRNGRYMAYSISSGGSDWKEIFVMNVETGEKLSDFIKWVKFSGISWYGDGFYYSGYNPPAEGQELTKKNEFHKLFYHKLGDLQNNDRIVLENKKVPSRMFYSSVTYDERYLIVYEENMGDKGNMVHVLDHMDKTGEFITITDNFENSYTVIGNNNEVLYISTDCKAPKNRLVAINMNMPSIDSAEVIIPEKENVLRSVSMCFDKFIVGYMKDAHSVIEVYNYNGNFQYEIELPALGSVDGFNGQKNDSLSFYTFTSYTYPSVVYKYDFSTKRSEIYSNTEIDFDFEPYETKQVFYPSKDGTKIPMFLIHKKGIKLDGNNPVILYGYGGFNISQTPGFRISRMIWLENGGVYAVANLRGGGEYGEEWHQEGTKLKKQNVFDDFISAAEYLIKVGYTNPEKLAIQGGSNGGLLVGACINQRPDLFKVALPAVGVMDMLRFQKFTIGGGWVSDYGSSDNEEEFKYIYKYSPLHNISDKLDYPAVLVTTADHDDRVVPSHSFKYIATLQEKYKGSNPVMIRVDVMAGHGAGKPTEKIIEEVVDLYSFVFYNMDITPIYK
ncbi:MAG: prolyl oligopeptidase family serine peptidase [Bacteroidota bacterium]